MPKRENKDNRDKARELLAWIAAVFAEENNVVSETIFHSDEIESPIPAGKAVKVTFELVDHTTCATCGGSLPLP